MVKSKVQKNNRHQTQKINLEKLCWKIVRIAQKNKKKLNGKTVKMRATTLTSATDRHHS